MENENLLMEVKPSAVVLIPHFCLMLVFVGFVTIWKPLFGIKKSIVVDSIGMLTNTTNKSCLFPNKNDIFNIFSNYLVPKKL